MIALPTHSAPNVFIRIDRRGIVTMVMPQVEMGQGICTAQPMLLARSWKSPLNAFSSEWFYLISSAAT